MSKTNTEDDAFNTVRIDVSSSPFLLDDKSGTILRMVKKRVEIFFSQVFRLEKKKEVEILISMSSLLLVIQSTTTLKPNESLLLIKNGCCVPDGSGNPLLMLRGKDWNEQPVTRPTSFRG